MSEPNLTVSGTELLYTVGRELWRSTLIGNAPPVITRLHQRMANPRPGDLVIEITSFRGFDPGGIGRLLSGERDGDRWVIEPLDHPDEEQVWHNAQFVALPDRPKWIEP